MARRGDRSGLPALRERFLTTNQADHLVEPLVTLGSPEAVDDLLNSLAAQAPDDHLVDLVRYAGWDLPWDEWAARRPRIAAAIERVGTARTNRLSREAPTDAPLDEVLAFDWSRPLPKSLRHRFRTALTPKEVRHLRDVAQRPEHSSARDLALAALGDRHDPAAIATAEDVFARNVIGRERAAAFRYVRALAADDALPLARRWIDLHDDRAGVAAALFAAHCEEDDVADVRRALQSSWMRRENAMYALCDLIEALGRHPALGPFPELTEVFESVEYSYARRRAAAVLAEADPGFATRYALECLWDCEPETRLIGAGAVRVDDDALDRLQQLEADDAEHADVRAAARAALGLSKP